MSKQRHDIGWKKRHRPQRSQFAPVNGSWLARKLVERGLADPLILGEVRYGWQPREPQ